jgi:hypothetical protein
MTTHVFFVKNDLDFAALTGVTFVTYEPNADKNKPAQTIPSAKDTSSLTGAEKAAAEKYNEALKNPGKGAKK